MMSATIITARRRLLAVLSRFRRDRSGVSAIEFAMVAPALIALYLGCMEVSDGVAVDRKVTLVARSLADITSQVQAIDNTGMNNILNAGTAVIAPYSANNLKIIVSSIRIDQNGIAKIDWSDARNTTARAKNQTVTLPAALVIPNTSLIWAEASYSYTPVVAYEITGTLNLNDQLYMRPRLSDYVVRNNT